MSGILYVVATPIGNMEDITLRALRILKEVDFVLCEDTRTTGMLLKKYEIKTKLQSYHAHSTDVKEGKIIELLKEGKNFALVSDAGTPCISDPGTKLVNLVQTELGTESVKVIPGPSALTALLSISGTSFDSVTFHGFMPHKKGRQTLMKEIAANTNASCFYESTHRIVKCLEEMNEFLPERKIIIGRELTKMFEEVLIGTAAELIEKINSDKNKQKGEFVVLVS